MTKRLLFVHHTVSPACHALYLAVLEGARHPAIEGVEVLVRPALSATAIDVLEADAYVLGTPVNLGYLSGAMKHFFDQIYYPCLDATRGRSFGAYLYGNGDATGALKALESITTGLGWKAAHPTLTLVGAADREALDAARELGSVVAVGLTL